MTRTAASHAFSRPSRLRPPVLFARGYPLRYTIAFVFTLLTLISGIVLIGFNYVSHEHATIIATHDLVEQIGQQVTLQVSESIFPVQSVINISSKTIRSVGLDFDKRLSLLEYFVEILRHNRRIASMTVADVDGDFFIVRSVENNPAAGSAFEVPPGTHFIIQGIDRELDDLVAEHLMFLDDKLFVITDRVFDHTAYDHRHETWFKASIYTHGLITTDTYLLFGTHEIGLTIARRLKEGRGVVAADVTLRDLSDRLAHQRITPSTELILLTGQGTIVGHSDVDRMAAHFGPARGKTSRLPTLADRHNPLYDQLAEAIAHHHPTAGQITLTTGSQKFLGYLSTIPINGGHDLFLASLIPHDELLHDVIQLRNQSILISLAFLFATILIVLWLAHRISTSLRLLARGAQRIREFKLDAPITVHTRILEVNDLAETMAMMKVSIEQFLKISRALSEEKDVDALLEMILREARGVSTCVAGAIGLRDPDDGRLEIAILHNDQTGECLGGPLRSSPAGQSLYQPLEDRPGLRPSAVGHAILTGEVVLAEDIQTDERFDYTEIRGCFDTPDFKCQALLIVPLINQKDEIIGTLQLVNPQPGSATPPISSPDIVSYIQALSSDAAVALDNRRLLRAQRDLTDAIVRLIADSIDAKSPYTSRHCKRVPVIVRMLAEAAHHSTDAPFRDFSLSEDDWYALHLASWLHDCGKVTTPEYVVDKATKLETIYNRIHEIRMRFEVLWRDAELDYHKALIHGADTADDLARRLNDRQARIRDDFAFVARCNIGGESMSQSDRKRLARIGAQTWLRHLDDRLGLSREELSRKQHQPPPVLPIREPLLADKREHLVPRRNEGPLFGNTLHGFAMQVPEYQANHGELTNLSVVRGTLTTEERFTINNHIIQTIRMLSALPWPPGLRQVPDWAGNHHEAYCGGGYPRGLVGRNLSIPERIMVVADVFEALTAADRPYKQPRTLSEALGIMKTMCRQGHLCPISFTLLLTSGVYRRYADATWIRTRSIRSSKKNSWWISSNRSAGHLQG
ncbi:HD domain-containing phosphohydrolase [Desulfosarcina cetonica]|uniref:HD domain-containing phosphohydrolase n=1 Tax=Desulfosarcina cetonica TaxID=90730 RepID=UPI0006D2C15E|nr:HD domain-containing phosphohydrolase [Desulfosarcina cetonica]